MEILIGMSDSFKTIIAISTHLHFSKKGIAFFSTFFNQKSFIIKIKK